MSHYLPHVPTGRLRILYVDTALQLRSLSQAVAAPRPRSKDVPPAILAETRRLLAAIARLMAREKHWCGGLRLEGVPGWPELTAKLAFAEAALRRFASLHIEGGDEDDEDDSGASDTFSRPAAAGFVMW